MLYHWIDFAFQASKMTSEKASQNGVETIANDTCTQIIRVLYMNPCPSSMHPSQGAHSRETQIDACLSNSWYRSHSWAVGIRFTGTHLYALFIATFVHEACTGSWASEAFGAYLWTLNVYQAFRKESLVLRCLSESQYVYRNPSCSGYQPITSEF